MIRSAQLAIKFLFFFINNLFQTCFKIFSHEKMFQINRIARFTTVLRVFQALGAKISFNVEFNKRQIAY
jgi:hypothetical protein